MKSMMLTFAILFLSLPAFALNSFTLYSFKSPTGVNWKSPKHLARSVVKNEVLGSVSGNKRILGHVAIDLRCQGKKLITAMTSRGNDTNELVLKQHSGLGVLLHVFRGELETEEKLIHEIAKKQRKGQVHSVTYLLSDEACQKMVDHFDNFVANTGPLNYGFPLDTLAGEGAGCSAFGVSFLQAAEVADPNHLRAWSGSVWIPQDLVGPYSDEIYTDPDQAIHPNSQGGDEVKLLSLVLKVGKVEWAKPNEPGAHYLEFYDPDTMFDWVESMAKKWHPGADYKKRTFNKSIDLVFDYR